MTAPQALPPVLIAVTDHAAERFRQRVATRQGGLDPRPEIVQRVGRAWQAGRVTDTAPGGASGAPASLYVSDLVDRDVVFVCRHDVSRGELVVVTLWETERLGAARVPRRFTDALREDPER